MVTEQQADAALLKFLDIREAREEWRLMYRWASLFYYKNKLTIAISHAVNAPEKNEAAPFDEPDDSIASLQLVKRVLIWQWNDKWVIVPPDELNALWSE